MQQRIITAFKRIFKTRPTHLIHSPGRVNIIGEHTDYNNGYVLPMAINRAITLAIAPHTDKRIRIYSANFHKTYSFPLTNIYPKHNDGWLAYPKGIAVTLQKAGYALKGLNAVLHGNIPRGAGLSSSAAIELAIAHALITASELTWDPLSMAKLAQRAENEWVGVNCGIMDQMTVACAKKDHALLIDCQDLSFQEIPLPPHTTIIIMDTATRRGLLKSAYNERRAQCEQAAHLLNIQSLRDLDNTLWEHAKTILPRKCLMRARHVFTENKRVLQAAKAMQKNDATTLGLLMRESHASLRDDFEVSSDTLNTMVNCATKHPACYGARVTGAGFAGCAVALVQASEAEDFKKYVAELYQRETSLKPSLYVTKAMPGVSCEEI